MSTLWEFQDCGDRWRRSVEERWAARRVDLEKLLPWTPRETRLTVRCAEGDPSGARHAVRISLHGPEGTLAAEAEDLDPAAALDRAVDSVSSRARREKSSRGGETAAPGTGRRADLEAAASLLEGDVRAGRKEDFFRLLRPLLGFLRDRARRELRILELEGRLHRGEVTVRDALDEVLVRAWDRFAERPDLLRGTDLPLDLWLTRLLDEVLQGWAEEEPRPHASLREPVRENVPAEAPQVGEQEWWAALLDLEETYKLEDLIPGWDGSEIWDRLDENERAERILSMLSDLPVERRQAFLLHALDDLDQEEIARLQDRRVEDVRSDIEEVRGLLRDRLRAGGFAGSAAASREKEMGHA